MIKENYYIKKLNGIDLGISRSIFYAYLFDYYKSSVSDLTSWKNVPIEVWQPIGLFKFIPTEYTTFLNTENFFYVFLGSLITSSLGIFTKLSTLIAFVTGYYFIGYPNNFGTIYDSTCIVTLTLGLLVFANSGNRFSIDSLIRKVRRKKPTTSINNFWFTNTLAFVFLLFFFSAGIQKLRLIGFDYFSSTHIAEAVIFNQAPGFQELIKHIGVLNTGAFFVVLLQLSALFVAIKRKGFFLYIYLILFFHLGIDLAMTKHFSVVKICYFFFFPWTSLISNISDLFKVKKLKSYFKEETPKFFSPLRKYTLYTLTAATILGALASVITLKHYWPFSTATMYAWPNNYPIKKKVILLENNDEITLAKSRNFYPLDRTKMRLSLKHLERENTPNKGNIVRKILSNNNVIADKVHIAHCLYQDYEDFKNNFPDCGNKKIVDTTKL